MKSITFVSVAAILSSTSAFSPSHIQLHERKIMNSISPSSNGASSLVATPTNTNPLHYNTQDKTSPLLFKVNEEDDTIAIENNKEMNQVLVEKEQLVKKSRVVRSTPIKNVVTLETMDDFKQHIESNEDKVVVVRFFASWCRVSSYRIMCHASCSLFTAVKVLIFTYILFRVPFFLLPSS